MPDPIDIDHFIPFKYKYCRMCAWELTQGVLIFGEEGKRLNIPEKIRKTLAILILEEDNLPKKICTDCCSSLEDYAKYKDTVLDAQDKLASIAKCIPPPVIPQRQESCRSELQDLRRNSRHPHPYRSDRKPDIRKLNSAHHSQPRSSAGETSSAFHCKNCGKKFQTRSEFTNHMESSHPVHRVQTRSSTRFQLPPAASQEDSSPAPSDESDSSDDSEDSDYHVTTIDLEDNDDMDDEPEIMPSPASKNKGASASVSSRGPEKDRQQYRCVHCEQSYTSLSSLNNHMIHCSTWFNCKDCDKSYSNKIGLTAHIKACHTNTPGSSLRVPPHGRRQYECTECQMSFSRKATLKEHERTHEEPVTYTCKICNRDYKTRRAFTKHKRIHTAANSYPCSVCDKSFCRRSKLEQHLNIHADRRPFGCAFCTKQFNSQSNYVKHFKRKHGEALQNGRAPAPVKLDLGPPALAPASQSKKKDSSAKDTRPQSTATPTATATATATSAVAATATSTAVQPRHQPVVPVSSNAGNNGQINAETEVDSHPRDPSPTWVDLTGKHPHSQQQQTSQSQSQPLTYSLQQAYAVNANIVQNSQHYLSTQSQSQSNSHLQQHQQHSTPSTPQLIQHSPAVHPLQHLGTTVSHLNNQQPSHSYSNPQHPQYLQNQSNNQQQQQSHGQTNVQQQQSQPHSNTPHHQPVQSQPQQQAHSHNQPSSSSSSIQHQQQLYPHPNNQTQLISHSHGQFSSQQQPVSHTTVPIGLPSSHQSHHQHQQQTNSHNPLNQGLQHFNHHFQQQQQQGLPLLLSSQHHYQHNSNHNNQPLNALDLVDCALQSAFAPDSMVPVGSQRNHPIDLNYKLPDSTFQQDVPMELSTKAFPNQSGPLELCVRNDFSQLVDLTAKEQSFNDRMNTIDFRSQQPMDLISRNDQPSLGQPDNNNLVDLSLRSSFQDQSAESSMLRELIDLSSRSDYHGELNLSLSSKGNLSHSHKGNPLQSVVYSDLFSLQN